MIQLKEEKSRKILTLETDEHRHCIENVPIFSTLDEDELYEVLMVASHRKLNKGETLYTEGDELEKLYVINKGKVKISKISREGKEQIIRILDESDFTGELSLFSTQAVKSNAEAITTTEVCIIEGEKIRELMATKSSIALKILKELSKRLEETEDLVETIGLQGVDEKVATLLLSLAKEDTIELSVSKRDLSAHIQISPETFSRRLTSFEEMGLIRQESSRRIIILDREALERFGE